VPLDQPAVIDRVLCLSSLVVRGLLESALARTNGPSEPTRCHELLKRLGRWLTNQNFSNQFTIEELETISTGSGEWTSNQHVEHGERMESLGILLWALTLEDDVPDYDQPFGWPDLEPILGWPAEALVPASESRLANFPRHGADLMLGITKLRPGPTLTAARGTADCWQWRTNVAAYQRAYPVPPPGHDYAMLIGIAAEEAYAAGAIGRPIQNDFPLGGRPFASLPQTDQARCARLATARHLALDWLCGYATAWDRLPAVRAFADSVAPKHS